MPNTPFQPEWKKHEADLRSPDIKKQHIATEAFDETRKKEMAVSAKARHWEEDRKQAFMKEKPNYVKQKRAEEVAPLEKFKQDLKQGGKFDGTLNPMPGYIVIKADETPEQTSSGLYVPDSASLKNTGIILAEGGVQYNDATVYHPLHVNERVLYKKGAGIDIELGIWGKCVLMTFNDILGVLN